MPGTGSPDAVGRTLETIAAAVQPPAVPSGYRLGFPILSPTSGWLLSSSSATATVRAPPTWPIFATSTRSAPGSASGCWLCAAAISRPTPASWSKPVGVAPLLPGGWPPWPAVPLGGPGGSTPPPPTFVLPAGRQREDGAWPIPRGIRRRASASRPGSASSRRPKASARPVRLPAADPRCRHPRPAAVDGLRPARRELPGSRDGSPVPHP
jgi:hypothetical protein